MSFRTVTCAYLIVRSVICRLQMSPKPVSNIATIAKLYYSMKTSTDVAMRSSGKRAHDRLGTQPRLASRPSLSRLRCRHWRPISASGRVKPGMRLLPQRDMAQRLDLSVGTVSKAYAEAEQRGLISGEVGRGTFVQRRRPEAPRPRRVGGDNQSGTECPALYRRGRRHRIRLSRHRRRRRDVEPARLSAASGLAETSRGDGDLARSLGVTTDAEQLFITHGGQHALSIALGMVAEHPTTPC